MEARTPRAPPTVPKRRVERWTAFSASGRATKEPCRKRFTKSPGKAEISQKQNKTKKKKLINVVHTQVIFSYDFKPCSLFVRRGIRIAPHAKKIVGILGT